MIEILIPELKATRLLQEKQRRYYWSRASELLFRREGIISVCRVTSISDDCSALVVCRDTVAPKNSMDVPRVYEGPIQNDSLLAFGLSAQAYETNSLLLENDPAFLMHLPEILVRTESKNVKVLQHDGDSSKWQNTLIQVQFLEGEGWEPILRATDPNNCAEGSIIVRRGKDLVIGFSVFDLLTRWLAVPPLKARYGGFTHSIRHDLLCRRFLSIVVSHFVNTGAPHPLTVQRWPKGYSSAFTLRHDYDRKANPSQLQKLLCFYDALDIRVSIGFLPYFIDYEAISAFALRGHEIQAHLSSPSQVAIRNDLRILRNQSAIPVCGVTFHGGPQGIGFRGQTHFEWFDDVGLTYCETFGIRDSIPVPPCRLYDDIPDCSCIIATPGHFSLDGSTAPDDHRLDTLISAVPRSLIHGNYTIVMNHPDIHNQQLCMLLSKINLHNVWRATIADVSEWHRVTHYESLVKPITGGYKICFSTSLPQVAVFCVGDLSYELKIKKGYQECCIR